MTPLRDQPPINRDLSWSQRVWTLIDGIYVLEVVLVVVCSVGAGVFVVGQWLIEAWGTASWWSFALQLGVLTFLIGGVVYELIRRRLGAFSLLVVAAAFILGVRYVVTN